MGDTARFGGFVADFLEFLRRVGSQASTVVLANYVDAIGCEGLSLKVSCAAGCWNKVSLTTFVDGTGWQTGFCLACVFNSVCEQVRALVEVSS